MFKDTPILSWLRLGKPRMEVVAAVTMVMSQAAHAEMINEQQASTGHLSQDPWADQVIRFVQGPNAVSGFSESTSVLGPPERNTGDGGPFAGQVTSWNPPFGRDEIVSIGAGGELVVRFEQPVMDNPNDVWFGIDLLIFSNAFYLSSVQGVVDVKNEPGRIQVSQTAEPGSWHDIPGVFADDAYPTEAYTNGTGPFAYDGTIPSDFTIPVNPAFDPTGLTYTQVVTGYQGSGGGTGVDISATGLPWIQFVRVYQDADDLFSTEIDAFADVDPIATTTPEPTSLATLLFALSFWLVRFRESCL